MAPGDNRFANDPGRACTLAAVAAVIATVGDLAMLYVANAGRPELGLHAAPAALLGVGALLGMVGIPIYAYGYRAVGTRIACHFPRAGRVIAAAGTVGSVLGALIHGCTALFIRQVVAAGGPTRDPISSLGVSPLLLVLWALATVFIVVASGGCLVAVRRGVPPLPRGLAWWNPAVFTALLALAGTATPPLRSFLVPAAPNLAHVLFFAGYAYVARRGKALTA